MRQLLALAVMCLAVSACSSEEKFEGGYRRMAVDGRNSAVVHGHEMVVMPNVDSCTAHGKYVVCLRSRPAGLDDPMFFSKPFGWFLLDTNSGDLVEGLDKDALQNVLQKRNVPVD